MRTYTIMLPDFKNLKLEDSYFDELINHPLENYIRKVIKENNQLTYFSLEERFPNCNAIEKTLSGWNIDFEKYTLNFLLWIMQFSSEIISIYFVEKPEKFEDYHFIDTDLYNLKNIKELFFNKISDLYKEKYGASITEKAILNILAIDPLLYSFKNQKEFLLYQYSRIYEIIKEFLEKIDREPDFFSLKEITNRKKYSIQKLKEKYKFLNKNVNTPEHKEEIPSEKKQNNKRAVDDPRWRNIEKSPFIDWDMVFKTFGPNMVIRILLRRQDYKLLKQMIEEKKIHNKEDLEYILYGLNKILEHNDLIKEKQSDFELLKDHVQKKLSS